ncbi:hypothetical protein [Neisseria arctica]|nr:hypothetical protein [Neisseria arctica]
MKTALSIILFSLLLSACTAGGGAYNQIYGEIKGGIETSHTKR